MGDAWVGVLRAVRFALDNRLHAERPEGKARAWKTSMHSTKG